MSEELAQHLRSIAVLWNKNNVCSEEEVESVLNSYRTLRNGCAGSPEYQTSCTSNASLLDDTLQVMEYLLNKEDETSALCVRVATQFLGNLIVNHSDNQLLVWDKFSTLLK